MNNYNRGKCICYFQLSGYGKKTCTSIVEQKPKSANSISYKIFASIVNNTNIGLYLS